MATAAHLNWVRSSLGVNLDTSRSSDRAPAPGGLAVRSAETVAEAEKARNDLVKEITEAARKTATVTDAAARAQMVATLNAANADRKKAETMGDQTARTELLKSALAKVRKSMEELGSTKNTAAAEPESKAISRPTATTEAATASATAPAQPKAAAGAASDDAKAAVLALRGQLEADQKKAYSAWAPLAEEQDKLQKEIATAKGDNKKSLEAIKKDVDKRAKEAEAQLKQFNADVEALDDPLVKRDAFTAILARHKSGVVVAAKEEIDKHDQSIEKKLPGNSKETRTTTSYTDGKAMTQTSETTTTLGLGGASKTTTNSRETITAGGSQKSEQSTTTKASLGGVSYEKSVKGESEKDGKTQKAERTTSAELGLSGGSVTESRSRTNADGSGSASRTSTGFERGEGKAGVVKSASVSNTDASGTTTTAGQTTKTGVIAGKDGLGTYAETNKSYEKKGRGGMTTGAVAGLSANVVCNVTAVKDSDPPMYELSMTVNFGASVGASKGQDKEGASAKGKLSVNASQAVSMKRTYRLNEAEAKVYVDSLKAASKGDTGGATQEEFAIIRTGASKSWDTACEMYLALSGKATKPEELAKLKTGESREVTSSTSVGANVSANAKAVGVELGVQVDRERSAKVTKEQDGSLTYDTKASESTKEKGKVSLSVGLVSGSGGASHSYATSTGYLISVDPKAKDAKAMQEALARCSNQAELDAFAAKYPQTVKEKISTTAKADTESAGLTVAGVGGKLDMGNTLNTSVTTDGQGNLKNKQVVGASNRSGEIGIGSLKLSASSKEQVEANIDADGTVTADVTRADSSTDLGKFVKAHNPFADKKDKKKTGALTKLAGGAEPEDTDSKEVYGIRLTNADLDRIGRMACSDKQAWDKCPQSPRELADWEKARKDIAAAGGDRGVVAEQLAVFIGSDKSSRLVSVNFWLRPDGKVSTGKRYEFPDALQSSKAAYMALVVNAAESTLEAQAKKEGAAKAAASGKEMFDKLDAMYRAIEGFKGFSQPAVRAEMMSDINARKEKVLKFLRGLQGPAPAANVTKQKTDEYQRILKACAQYEATQNDSFAKIDGWYRPGSFRYADEIVRELKQVRDLHAIWWRDYKQLEALGKEIGQPEGSYSKLKPNTDRLQKTERKVLF